MKRTKRKKSRFFIISIVTLALIVFLGAGTLAETRDRSTLVQEIDRIQTEIESGDLARARREIDRLKDDRLSPVAKATLQAVEGNLQFSNGDYTGAIESYTRALPLLEGVDREWTTLALANAYLYRSRFPGGEPGDRDAARRYLAPLLHSDNTSISLRSRLTILEIDPERGADAGETLQRILSLPEGDERAIALARLAPLTPSPPDTFENALESAAEERTKLAVFLKRSRWELQNDRPGDALQHSESAVRLADSLPDRHSSLVALSLLARSYLQLGFPDRAERSYTLAMDAVSDLRRIYAGNPIPATVLDEIDSTVRAYLQLTLDSREPDLERAARLIRLSGQTVIDRYFRSVCSPDGERTSRARPVIPTATILTAALPNAFHAIAVLPDGSYLHSRSPETADEIERLAGEWRKALSDSFFGASKPLGERFYQLILRPFEERLRDVGRLVFINDVALLNVPMAALWNGKDYLISRYAVLYSVGDGRGANSSLPKPALLVSAYPGKGLPGTKSEIEGLQTLLGAGESLEADSVSELPRRLRSSRYRLLHIATHSIFGEGARGAYMTIGRETLTPRQFQELLRARDADLDHLTLSSCDSAQGDKYATLGLSGIALRSGLRSVLGSLWVAPDLGTVELMNRFYRAWQELDDPAAALRVAQKEMLAAEETLSSQWAGFVLLVN